jgi:hypothetical protein
MQVVPWSRGITSDSFELVVFSLQSGRRLAVIVILRVVVTSHSVVRIRRVNIARLRSVSARSHWVKFRAVMRSLVVVLWSAT